MVQVTFANPRYLWYLITIPLLIISHFYFLRYTKHKGLRFANFEALQRVEGTRKLTRNYTLLAVRIITLSCLVLAAAGTTVWYQGQATTTDFVLAIDSSASMTANDVKPSRLTKAKTVANDLLTTLQRNNIESNVGVLSFSGQTYIQTRVTEDYRQARRALQDIQIRKEGGTDLAGAIITGVNLLAESQSGSMVIISDGSATLPSRDQSFRNALQYAQNQQIALHTVGMGTENGTVGYLPEYYNITSTFQAETLKNIANSTQGTYHYVNDDFNVTTMVDNVTHRSLVDVDLASWLLLAGILLLFLEWGLLSTKYRRLP